MWYVRVETFGCTTDVPFETLAEVVAVATNHEFATLVWQEA